MKEEMLEPLKLKATECVELLRECPGIDAYWREWFQWTNDLSKILTDFAELLKEGMEND